MRGLTVRSCGKPIRVENYIVLHAVKLVIDPLCIHNGPHEVDQDPEQSKCRSEPDSICMLVSASSALFSGDGY
jgi:hypothetical protein